MHVQTRWLKILSLTLTAAILLAACAPVATDSGSQGAAESAAPVATGPTGALRIATTTDIGAIEIPFAQERNAINAAWTMYDSLLWLNDDGKLEPALAESWETSADGLSYTFKLRQDVTFHDGTPFNADAVVFTQQTYNQPEVVWVNEWQDVTVEKIDDFTVKLTTKEPNALFLRMVANRWAIISPTAYGKLGKEGFAQAPVGTGPFVFKEWVKGDHLTVTANPNYWRKGYPKVAEITFRAMPESATRVAAIQAGEIDLATRLNSDEASSFEGNADVSIVRYPVDRAYYVAFNNVTTGKGTPIEDQRVRLAINMAINRQEIVDTLFGGFATLSTGMVGPGTLGDDGGAPIPFDLEKAKSLLAEAGYPDGFDIGMACPDGAYANINEVCQAIQGYLKDVGINVDLKIQEANAYWDLEAKKELPPLFVDGWSVTEGESYTRLQGSLGADQTYAAWSDPELQAKISSILTTLDDDKRAALYSEVQKTMRENPPFVYLYYVQTFEAVSSKVQNYKPRSAENWYLWNVGVGQ